MIKEGAGEPQERGAAGERGSVGEPESGGTVGSERLVGEGESGIDIIRE
jgi:hypothetical protein